MPDLIGLEHFNVAERCVQHMQKNNALSDIISIFGKTMPCAPRFHLKKFLFFLLRYWWIVWRRQKYCINIKKMEKYFSPNHSLSPRFSQVSFSLIFHMQLKDFSLVFLDMPGKFVSLKDTVKSFKAIPSTLLEDQKKSWKNKKVLQKKQKKWERQLEQEKRASESNVFFFFLLMSKPFYLFFLRSRQSKSICINKLYWNKLKHGSMANMKTSFFLSWNKFLKVDVTEPLLLTLVDTLEGNYLLEKELDTKAKACI